MTSGRRGEPCRGSAMTGEAGRRRPSCCAEDRLVVRLAGASEQGALNVSTARAGFGGDRLRREGGQGCALHDGAQTSESSPPFTST